LVTRQDFEKQKYVDFSVQLGASFELVLKEKSNKKFLADYGLTNSKAASVIRKSSRFSKNKLFLVTKSAQKIFTEKFSRSIFFLCFFLKKFSN